MKLEQTTIPRFTEKEHSEDVKNGIEKRKGIERPLGPEKERRGHLKLVTHTPEAAVLTTQDKIRAEVESAYTDEPETSSSEEKVPRISIQSGQHGTRFIGPNTESRSFTSVKQDVFDRINSLKNKAKELLTRPVDKKTEPISTSGNTEIHSNLQETAALLNETDTERKENIKEDWFKKYDRQDEEESKAAFQATKPKNTEVMSTAELNAYTKETNRLIEDGISSRKSFLTSNVKSKIKTLEKSIHSKPNTAKEEELAALKVAMNIASRIEQDVQKFDVEQLHRHLAELQTQYHWQRATGKEEIQFEILTQRINEIGQKLLATPEELGTVHTTVSEIEITKSQDILAGFEEAQKSIEKRLEIPLQEIIHYSQEELDEYREQLLVDFQWSKAHNFDYLRDNITTHANNIMKAINEKEKAKPVEIKKTPEKEPDHRKITEREKEIFEIRKDIKRPFGSYQTTELKQHILDLQEFLNTTTYLTSDKYADLVEQIQRRIEDGSNILGLEWKPQTIEARKVLREHAEAGAVKEVVSEEAVMEEHTPEPTTVEPEVLAVEADEEKREEAVAEIISAGASSETIKKLKESLAELQEVVTSVEDRQEARRIAKENFKQEMRDEIEEMREEELANPEIRHDYKFPKKNAILAFKYLRGQINEEEMPSVKRSSEATKRSAFKIKGIADKEAAEWKDLFDKINTKYDTLLEQI